MKHSDNQQRLISLWIKFQRQKALKSAPVGGVQVSN